MDQVVLDDLLGLEAVKPEIPGGGLGECGLRQRTDDLHRADVACVGRHALQLDRPQQLVQEKRVAAGGSVADAREGGVRVGAEARPDQLRRRARAQQIARREQRDAAAGERFGGRQRLGAAPPAERRIALPLPAAVGVPEGLAVADEPDVDHRERRR